MSDVELLTVAEVAQKLRISTTAVYELCESGKLPCFKIGSGSKRKRVRISRESVSEYLKQCAYSAIPQQKPTRSARIKPGGYDFLRSLGAKI